MAYIEIDPMMPAVAAVQTRVGACELTGRQTEIMALVVAGDRSKTIAANLGISQRTVENHRASIMRKTGSLSIPALVRFSIRAAVNGDIIKSPLLRECRGPE